LKTKPWKEKVTSPALGHLFCLFESPFWHVFGGLCGQDPVVGSGGFDGLNDEGGSDYFGYYPPLPTGVALWGPFCV
jgi:hypothetical protein